ncbi:hypothetical protein EJB05_41350, partial [Eragrostis curvula]
MSSAVEEVGVGPEAGVARAREGDGPHPPPAANGDELRRTCSGDGRTVQAAVFQDMQEALGRPSSPVATEMTGLSRRTAAPPTLAPVTPSHQVRPGFFLRVTTEQ